MSLPRLFAALAADRSLLSALLEQIPAGVCVYDPEGRPLLSNPSFEHILGGVPPGVQAGSPLSPLVARALAGERLVAVEVDLPPGARPPARLSAFATRDDGGHILGAIVVISEGTSAASAEATQRETLGIVGHDLRNPLAAIRMTAQLLSRPDEMVPERRITLSKRILSSSTRMDSIVKSLLDYARARPGALVRLERETVDLARLAMRVIEEHTATLAGRSVALHTTGDVVGQWDPGRLEQIVGQLVSNALRHGADPVTLTLDGRTPERVSVAVHNHGPTIPTDLLPGLFDPFRVGPRPEGTQRRSIGLGLFIVRELATAHGGSVDVESRNPDGTRFTVTLPRHPPRAEHETKPAAR